MFDDILKESDYRNILEFQENIQVDSDDFVENVLLQIKKMFGYECLSFFHVNEEGEFHNPQHINFGDEAIRIYTEHYYKRDPFYFKNLKMSLQFRESAFLAEVVEKDDFTGSEYFTDFFERFGFNNEIALYLKSGNRHIGAMGVMRFKGDRVFTNKDNVLLNTLAKIIAYQLNEHIVNEQNKQLKMQYDAVFKQNPVGIVVLDSEYRLIDCNDSACRYFEAMQMTAAKGLAQDTIDDLFNANLDQNGKPFGRFNVGCYEFQVVCSAFRNFDNRENINNYIVYIKRNEDSLTFENCVMEYRLTKREQEVINLIGKGLTNKQISEYLFISPQTVRTHIENIMIKTNTDNRTAILYKVGKIK